MKDSHPNKQGKHVYKLTPILRSYGFRRRCSRPLSGTLSAVSQGLIDSSFTVMGYTIELLDVATISVPFALGPNANGESFGGKGLGVRL